MDFVFKTCAIVLSFAFGACSNEKVEADMIIYNANIYTVNESQPWAEAVAMKGGRFLAIGKN